MFITGFAQINDSTDRALEIYRKGGNKSYIIKMNQRVQIPCRHIKHGYKKMVTAELIDIDGKKMVFHPLNSNYSETTYTTSTIKEIGVRTPFRVMESVFWFSYKLAHHEYWNVIDDDLRGTFRVISFRSRKWGIRIIEL